MQTVFNYLIVLRLRRWIFINLLFIYFLRSQQQFLRLPPPSEYEVIFISWFVKCDHVKIWLVILKLYCLLSGGESLHLHHCGKCLCGTIFDAFFFCIVNVRQQCTAARSSGGIARCWLFSLAVPRLYRAIKIQYRFLKYWDIYFFFRIF